ncbi:unnamed protein product, partial [Ixodes hexagonus]
TSPLDTAIVFGHGRFQRLVMVCATLSIFVSLSHSLGIMVLARPVDHWCKPPHHLADTPAEVWMNQSVPVEADGSYSRCTRYEPPRESGNLTGNRFVVFCEAWDYNLTNGGESIVSQWNLVCSRRWLLTLQPVAYLGGTWAACVMGYLGDSIGRRPVFLVALLVLLASGTATVFAYTVAMFTTLRAITSASSLTVMTVSSVLLFEVTKTTHRVVFSAFAACFSSAMLPPFNLLLKAVAQHWIVAQAMLMIPTSFLLLAVYAMKESPCWLLAKCDYEGTERVVLSAAKINGIPLTDVKAKMKKIRHALLRRGCVKTDAKRSSALDLVLNAFLRGRAITIFGSWFLMLFFFYDTFLSETLAHNTSARMTYVLVRIPVPIAFMFVLHHISRRRVLFLTMVQMSVLLGFQAWLVHQKDESVVILATVILGGIVVDTMVMTAFVYTLEIFPTVQRGLGLSLSLAIGRLGGMFTPLIKGPDPWINRAIGLAVGAVALTLMGLAVLLLPETTEVTATNTIREAELEDKWR